MNLIINYFTKVINKSYWYVEKNINWPKRVNFDKKNDKFDVWVLSDLTNSYIDKSLENINF